MKKTIIFNIILLVIIMMTGCKVPQSSAPQTVPYTVGMEKKIKGMETEVQFWSSEDVKCTLNTTSNGYSVDEVGTIVENLENSKNVFYIKRNTPGILVKIEKGIYWIKFDKDDERLVPFQKVGGADSDVFQLAVQNSDITLVLLSDKKKYKHSGNPFLKVSKKFASSLDNNSKVANGVKVTGE